MFDSFRSVQEFDEEMQMAEEEKNNMSEAAESVEAENVAESQDALAPEDKTSEAKW